MSNIEVLAGDFLNGVGSYQKGCIHLETALHPWPGINMLVGKVHRLFVADEGSWVMAFPRKAFNLCAADLDDCHTVAFMVMWTDGRILLGSASSQTVRRIVDDAMSQSKH